MQAFEMRCYQRLLNILYMEHVTNEKVCRKIQAAINGEHDMTLVKKWKLRWFGHISRSSGLVKTILQDLTKESGSQRWDRHRQLGQLKTGHSGKGL